MVSSAAASSGSQMARPTLAVRLPLGATSPQVQFGYMPSRIRSITARALATSVRGRSSTVNFSTP
jgi:hypothetical protein